MKKLSKMDEDTLCRALKLHDEFDGSGIFPQGSGQASHFRKLERLGLIEFEGVGFDLDGLVDDDVPIYKLTEDGLEVARILNIGGSMARIERILERIGE